MASPIASSSSQTLDDEPEDAYIDHLLILYASETGNAQDTAERVGREVRRRGRRCIIQSMDRYDVTELPHVPLVVLITSTHGRGDPPPTMLPLWTALLRKSLPPDILEDVNFAVFGLGDSSYERFAYAAKLLHRRLVALGAQPIVEATYGDERAPEGMEQGFLPWLGQLMEGVISHLRPEAKAVEWASTDLGEPIYRICFTGSNNGHNNGEVNGDHLVGIDRLKIEENGDTEVAPVRLEDALKGKAHEVWKPDDWTWAYLRKNERVTKEHWWQDVREIELEFEDANTPAYLPASIAELQPAMSSSEVDEFLESQEMTEIADKPIHITSVIPDQPLPVHLPPNRSSTTLRRLLTHHLDLRCTPRKSFFEWLRRLSTDEREQERLDEFLSDPDEIHEYATRPRRSILEALADFRQVRIPLLHLLEMLPPLRRRQFSIASSYGSHPGRIQLLIAMVEYKTNLRAPRKGLCSSWLQDLPIGSRIPIRIASPTLYLPDNPTIPVILVGPGTGVAPMRAFLEERVRQGAAANTALYFGCRSLVADHYYAPEWEEYRSKGARVRVAASRDGPEKVYVQDLIKEDKAMIKNWIVDKKGHIYICGSSNAMPKSVREALSWCISTAGAGNLSEEEAVEYVERMFDQGRGGEESW